jgi:hypothetical protein
MATYLAKLHRPVVRSSAKKNLPNMAHASWSGREKNGSRMIRGANASMGLHEEDALATMDDRFLMVARATSKNNA